MKFLCDRCKTRYSIGDERVRGKILKIRCKNCANVITVREGMTDADAAAPAAAAAPGQPRRTKTTTAAPAAEAANGGSNKGNQALGAAFASAMSKPPPALEEEWYVSIDGEQAGPFSLADAQRWVGGKPIDADLHCWSEGFDDWLPVDKVSHFRGLRKKPTMPPPMPPPVPRAGVSTRATTAVAGRAAQAVALREPEEEPKPLFAATMASLEKSAPVVASSNGALRVEARANGVALPSPRIASLPAAKPAATVKGLGLKPATAQRLGLDPDLDSATQTEAAAFQDEAPTEAEPAAARRLDALAKDAAELPKRIPLSALAGGAAAAPALPRPQFPPSTPDVHERATVPAAALADAPPVPAAPEPESDDLDIGEVSRVVKLADLMAKKPAATAKRTGAVAKLPVGAERVSGKVNATAPVPLIDAVETVPGSAAAQPADLPLETAAPIVAATHRRGLIALLVGAAILVGAAVVVVILVLNKREEGTTIGSEYTYNSERPDQPAVRRPGDPTPGSNEPHNPFMPPKPPPRKITYPAGSQRIEAPPQPTGGLKTDEIEAMGRKYNDSTLACFRRADKGADSIRLADVKKVILSFTVAPDGSVSNVNVSEKSSAVLVSCLQRLAGSWKFRPNPGGNYGLTLAKPE